MDALKAIAILAVVAIHVLATFYRPTNITVALVTSGAVSFAVPLFIAISVYFAAIEWERSRSWAVVWRRIVRLAPLYVVWSAIYLLVRWGLGDAVGADIRRHGGIDLVLRGAAAPHLYFLPVLIEVLLVLPLLARLVRTPSSAWVALVLGTAALAVCVPARHNGVAAALIERDWLPVWLTVTAVGIAATRDAWRVPMAALWTLVSGAALLAYAGLLRHDPPAAHQLYALAPIPALVAGLLTLGRTPHQLPRWLTALGRMSLGVYLVHIIVLRVLVRLVHLGTQGLAGVAAITAVVTVLSIVVVRIVDLTPARVLFDGRWPSRRPTPAGPREGHL